jgi:hypothetical protein
LKAFIRTLAVALAAVLALGTPSVAAQGHYTDGISVSDDQYLILVSEGGRPAETNTNLAIQPPGVSEGETRGKWVECTDTNDPVCATNNPKNDLLGWSVLPHCSIASSKMCLESFQIGNLEQPLAEAKYLGAAKTSEQSKVIAADEKRNFIEGGTPSLFEGTGVNHVGGSATYAVAVRLSQHFDYKLKKYVTTDLTASVVPYVIGSATSCAFRDGDSCAAAQDFSAGTRVSLKFRIPTSIGGWFSGRMKSPDLSVTKFAAGINEITIEAEPVRVDALALPRDKKAFTSKEKMWLNNNGNWGFAKGTATGAPNYQPVVFEYIDYYRQFVSDTSAGADVVWNMSTRSGGSGSGCLADTSKVLGIVTTNALGYAGESPSFNKGFLDYKVAGLHYQAGGKDLVLGSYDLVMRSDTARCLYGFSKAPLSATVSVTGGSGEKNVATTVVSEKNGWLKMAAYGFTFSKKTIKVKITKKKK